MTVPAPTTASDRLRDLRVENILKEDVITSMAIGFLPFPLLDAGLYMALQVGQVRELCREYRVPFSHYRAETAVSALVGAAPVLSVMGVSSLVKVFPGFGYLAGGALLATLSGAVTYAQGRVLANHLALGGTLIDFDPERARPAFRKELRQALLRRSQAYRSTAGQPGRKIIKKNTPIRPRKAGQPRMNQMRISR